MLIVNITDIIIAFDGIFYLLVLERWACRKSNRHPAIIGSVWPSNHAITDRTIRTCLLSNFHRIHTTTAPVMRDTSKMPLKIRTRRYKIISFQPINIVCLPIPQRKRVSFSCCAHSTYIRIRRIDAQPVIARFAATHVSMHWRTRVRTHTRQRYFNCRNFFARKIPFVLLLHRWEAFHMDRFTATASFECGYTNCVSYQRLISALTACNRMTPYNFRVQIVSSMNSISMQLL